MINPTRSRKPHPGSMGPSVLRGTARRAAPRGSRNEQKCYVSKQICCDCNVINPTRNRKPHPGSMSHAAPRGTTRRAAPVGRAGNTRQKKNQKHFVRKLRCDSKMINPTRNRKRSFIRIEAQPKTFCKLTTFAVAAL